ncbi:glycyl-radical enzyme activating protein [Bacillota bacterium Meth-B3]
MSQDNLGLIADIQRYSLHDGPGIRTSVFMKGCNLHCPWCHNPETISCEVEELVEPDKCIHCGECAHGCYAGARRTVGQWMSSQEVLEQVLLDRAYYAREGGLTVTGGEPLLQARFVEELLVLARKEGVHCAMESNLLAPWETLQALLPRLDLLMCDLKLWDGEAHRRWTGAGNEIILSNMRAADREGVPMMVRVPVVCGVNDGEENIRNTAKFLSDFDNLICLDLLPYHALGLSKHLASGRKQPVFSRPSAQALKRLADAAGSYRIQVRVAGVSAQSGQ